MAFGVTACGDAEWDGTNMTQWGNRVVGSNGGFVAETDKYVYYINGHTSYGDDNSFGAPVKGALMAAKKSSFATGTVETQVVVPKLFVATDYEAGVFIYGDYVYYGTPSTDKNNHGETASGEMTFTRTKLDGSETKTFFTVDFLNYTYRFVERDGTVYLIYYNTPDSSLVCYNTKTESSVVIAKTDFETKGKYESLGKYAFLSGEGVDGLTLVYTATVYSEDYFEGAAAQDGYERATENFNKVYAYRAGDGVNGENEFRGTCILYGGDEELTFENTLLTKDFYMFKQTDLQGKSKTKAVSTSDLVGAIKQGQTQVDALMAGAEEIKNVDYATSANVIYKDANGDGTNDWTVYTIVSGEDVTTETGETVASSDVFVVKTSLIGDLKTNFKRLARVGTASSLYDIVNHNGELYAYYYNSMMNFSRIKLNDADEGNFTEFYKEERISEDSVASAWYEPELVTIKTGDRTETYALYLDNTSKGASYIKYVKVFDSKQPTIADGDETLYNQDTNVVIVPEYKDDEETEIKSYALKGQKFIGEITADDTAATAIAELNEIEAPITWEVKGDTIVVNDEQVKEARAAYNLLTDSAKETYGEANLAKLEGAEKAVTIIKKLAKLDGIVNYEFYISNKPEGEADKYKAAYNDVKTVMEEVKFDNNVLDFIDNNLKWAYYEKAVDLFA